MSDTVVKHYDFSPKKFPITIAALHPVTRAVVWSETIEKPEGLALLYIPPLKKQLGHPVLIRTTYGDGSVDEVAPESVH